MAPKPHSFQLKDPIFQVTISVLVGSVGALEKLVKLKGAICYVDKDQPLNTDDFASMFEGVEAATIGLESGGKDVILWLGEKFDIGPRAKNRARCHAVLAHEATHVSQFVLDWHDISIPEQLGEMGAYYTGFIVQEVTDRLLTNGNKKRRPKVDTETHIASTKQRAHNGNKERQSRRQRGLSRQKHKP